MASSSTIEMILTISQQYSISTIFITFIFGLIGNALNILVFTRLKIFQQNQCVFYLLVESIVNIGSLIFYFVLRLITSIYGSDLTQYSFVWCKLRTMIAQIFLLIGLYSVCLVAFDQFLSTSCSWYLRQRSTLRLAQRLVTIAICFSLCHSILFGVFFDVKPIVNCVASFPILTQYYSYFFYPILCGLFPILFSGLVGILAYRNVRHIIRRQIPIVRRRTDRQLTQFVLIRVGFLIILVTPIVIYRVYILNVIVDPNDTLRLAIEKLLLAIIGSIINLNYAVNFYIFLVSSSRYRRQVKSVLIKKYWQQWKRRLFSNRTQVAPSIAPIVSSIELK